MFDIDDDTTQTVRLVNGGDPSDLPANLAATGTSEASESDLAKVYGDGMAGGDHLGHKPGPDRRDDGYVYPPKAHAAKRAARLRKPDKFALRRLADSLDLTYPNPPETLLAARRAALDAVRAAEHAAEEIEALPSKVESANAAHAAAAAAAHAAGKPIPAGPKYDPIAAEAIARQVYNEAIKAAEAEAAKFAEVKRQVTDEWRRTLVGEVDPSWEALEGAVREVAQRFRHWSAAKGGAETMSRDLGVFGPTDHQSTTRGLEGAGMAGLAKLVALVEQGDDVATGAYLAQTV